MQSDSGFVGLTTAFSRSPAPNMIVACVYNGRPFEGREPERRQDSVLYNL
jgi:hypothetical protein